MKAIKSAVFTLILLAICSFQMKAQKSQEELNTIQKEIDSYCKEFTKIIAPIKEQYWVTNSVFDNPDFAKIQSEIDRLHSISTQALNEIEAIPAYQEETWLKPVVQKYAMEFQSLAKTKIQKLLIMRKASTAYTKTEYENLVSDVNNIIGAVDRNLLIAPSFLFANLWAIHSNEAFCNSFHTYLNSMAGKFESIKGGEDPDIPLTWNCNVPFAGASQSQICQFGSSSCHVKFYSSANFEEAKSIHNQIWIYVLSCKPPEAYHDCFTLKEQADIDRNNENTIDYLLRFRGGDEAIVRLKNLFGKYEVELVFQRNKYE